MLYEICKWYSLVISVISALSIIVKDGKSTTDYTGKFKLAVLMANAPLLYFIIASIGR